MRRTMFRSVLLAAALAMTAVLFQAPVAHTVPIDTTADNVFGQPNMTSGFCNGGGIGAATLCLNRGTAVDGAGNVYIADWSNHRVLEFDTPLTTDFVPDRVFGQTNFTSGTCNRGGSLAANTLCFPNDVAVDSLGNLYVADANNDRVLEYDDPLGTDTVADRVFGQPDFTTTACSALNASTLCVPHGVAVSSSGDLFVADSDSNRVLEYDNPLSDAVAERVFGQELMTTEVCGTGATGLCFPTDVSVDGLGNVYVADRDNSRVVEFDDPQSSDTTADNVIGQANMTGALCNRGAAPAANALCSPQGVTVDVAGTVYVADTGNSRVLEYNDLLQTDEVADRVLGQPDMTGGACNAVIGADTLCSPIGLSLDSSGSLYVGDYGNDRVLRFKGVSPQLAGDRVFGPGAAPICDAGTVSAVSLCNPYAAAFDDATNNLYVADLNNSRVLRFFSPVTTDLVADGVIGQPGMTSKTCNNGGISASTLCNPTGVALDAAGNLYVVDSTNNRVLQYNNPLATDFIADRVFGQPTMATAVCDNGGVSASSLCQPDKVAFDPSGDMYISDLDNSRILAYDDPQTDTVADRVYGQPNMTGTACNNGGLGASRLCFAIGLAFDVAGNFYVSDVGNNRLLIFDASPSDATADVVIGQPDMTSDDCNRGAFDPAANTLCGPEGVAVDSAGDLYVVDSTNHRVLQYDSPLTDGTADAVYGQGGDFTTRVSNKGGLSSLSFAFPRGIAIDAARNFYVADFSNHRVVEYDYCLSPTDCDSDGEVDASDNCDLDANPAQTNTDAANTGLGFPGADALGDACDVDDDGDGCSDAEESQTAPLSWQFGGQRNPLFLYDVYDVNGTGKVDAADIGLVRARFTGGAPTPPENKIYDRGPGTAVWAPGPPNGVISAQDIGLVRASFNTNCQNPP